MSKLTIRKENEPNAQLKSMNSIPMGLGSDLARASLIHECLYLVHWYTRYSLIHTDTADVVRKFWVLQLWTVSLSPFLTKDGTILSMHHCELCWDSGGSQTGHNLVSSSFEYFDKRDYEKKIGVLVCVVIRNHIWTWCYICGPNISKSIQQIPNVC